MAKFTDGFLAATREWQRVVASERKIWENARRRADSLPANLRKLTLAQVRAAMESLDVLERAANAYAKAAERQA